MARSPAKGPIPAARTTLVSSTALALAEAWESWDAEEAVWQGGGRQLLHGRPEPVVGLWWD